MSLPSEIRNRIYEYSLYRVAIYPHGRGRKDASTALRFHPHLQQLQHANTTGPSMSEVDPEPPNLALLGVNHEIRKEALAIYLGRNIVVLPGNVVNLRICDPTTGDLECRMPSIASYLLTLERRPYIKTIKIDFSTYDVSPDFRPALVTRILAHRHNNGGSQPNTHEEWRDRVHYEEIIGLVNVWRYMLRVFSLMEPDLLIIDLTWCYCLSGCCRIVDVFRLSKDLIGQEKVIGKPKEVRVVGSLGAHEKDKIIRVLAK